VERYDRGGASHRSGIAVACFSYSYSYSHAIVVALSLPNIAELVLEVFIALGASFEYEYRFAEYD